MTVTSRPRAIELVADVGESTGAGTGTGTSADTAAPRKRNPFQRFGRMLWVATLRYLDNEGSLRAAGLTYLSLMALVPGLTVVLLIASAFGVKEKLRAWVDEQAVDWSKQLVEIKDAVLGVVDNVRLELLGAFGLLVFVWIVMSLLARVENALNVTWRAGRSRTLARRYADYVAILFLVPLLVLVATGLKASLALDDLVASVPFLAQVVESGLDLLPVALIWLAMTLVYKVMPNVRVSWSAACFAGLLAGASWFLAQSVFLLLQIGISRSNAIYGSLALLPVFLFYLYFSWAIVLWGAEFCHVFQNRVDHVGDDDARKMSSVQRRRLALGIVRGAVERFREGKSLSLSEYAGIARVSRRSVDDMVAQLVQHSLLHRVDGGRGVIPSRPPGSTPLQAILEALDGTGAGDVAGTPPLPPEDEAVLSDLRARATEIDGMI